MRFGLASVCFTPNGRVCGGGLTPFLAAPSVEYLQHHPFFATIDWRALRAGQLATPFTPQVSGSSDIRYFDESFTKLGVSAELDDKKWMQGDSLSGSNPFQGFTYEAPSDLRARSGTRDSITMYGSLVGSIEAGSFGRHGRDGMLGGGGSGHGAPPHPRG